MPRAATQSIINGQTASDATLDDAPGPPGGSGFISADDYSDANGLNGLRLRCIVGSGGAFTTGVGGPLVATDILDARALMGRGIGYVDVHLLASATLGDGCRLWTLDRRLTELAQELGVSV